ncbi:MAG: glycoside hydrolase family 3 protein, partial [Balneolales bacterium]|nr:glycoside hydrolase family 3 protein [Balneolales bacterium]
MNGISIKALFTIGIMLSLSIGGYFIISDSEPKTSPLVSKAGFSITQYDGSVTETELGTATDLSSVISLQARDLLNEMTLREKIAQLFIIRASGNYYAEDDDEFRRLSRMVQEYGIGGIIYFRGDIYNQAVLNNKLQARAKIPLWISQDMEFGAAMRISNTTRITPAMGVAATGNPRWAFEKGRITAMEARAIGVHQVYAPVVDINNNPDNPVINVRSFSEDAETVSVFAEAFIKGIQSQGLIATAKHFPGHGDTNTDSHTALPIITSSYEDLLATELIPFKRVIDAGVTSIMSAHIAFPALTSGDRKPATLDGRILNAILRDSLGFDGVIVTDGLEMQGIAAHYAPGEAAVMALNAGADLLLLSPDEMTAIYQIEEAVARGEISVERIEASVLKLLKWKLDAGLFRQSQVNINRIPRLVNTRSSQMIADQIARESITLLKNERDILPIRPDRYPNVTVIAFANSESGTVG